MPRAILITGNSRRFLENNLRLKEYLEYIGIRNIPHITCAYAEAAKTRDKLARLIANDIDEPLLICYSGHGSKRGIAINEDQMILYPTLLRLMHHHSRILLILDCCHAFGFVVAPENNDASEHISLIAACGRDEKSSCGLLEDLIHHWSSGEAYPLNVFVDGKRYSHTRQRWGNSFDHYFFPR